MPNVVAIPAAADAFLRWGLDLPMAVGAIAMSTSTIIVAAKRAVASTPEASL